MEVEPCCAVPQVDNLATTADIDVIIPTLRRPEGLTRALRSVFAQARAAELIACVVVVDNSPEGSATAVVEALRADAPVALILVHEPNPGVATARNAGLAACSAPLVAFLDDDEEAAPDWLEHLRAAHLALGSAVTFGPVQGVAGGGDPTLRPYFDRFFSRVGGEGTTLIDEIYGCGNSMMTRADALAGPEPFDRIADATGGEDDRLFQSLRARGIRFGWAGQARVIEYASPERSRLSYAFKRAFCYGQSPSQACARAGDPLGIARWMVIGAGQALVYGAGAAAMLLTGRRLAGVGMADRAVRGVGKVLWPFEITLYGLPRGKPPRGRLKASAPTKAEAAPSARG